MVLAADNTYRVPARNLGWLRERLDHLVKRATRLGLTPPALDVLRTETERKEGETLARVFHIVRVTGETPKLNGWEFVATLQHEAEGTIVRSVPTADLAEGALAAYRDAGSDCDHCGWERKRNDTYVLRSDEGALKQVGSTCLKDFLGHDDPKGLASLAELLGALGEAAAAAEDEGLGGFGGSGSWAFALKDFLALTAISIREHGWLSRGKAYEEGRGDATADLVWSAVTSKVEKEFNYPKLATEDDWAEGKRLADESVRRLDETEDAGSLSDYEHNLLVALRSGVVTARTRGLAASAVNYVRRAEGREASARAAENSDWFGEIKKRDTFALTVLRFHSFEGNYGPTTVVNFLDGDGNKAVWWASGGPKDWLKIGETFTVKATPKKHGLDNNGNKETTLLRVTPVKAKKAKKEK